VRKVAIVDTDCHHGDGTQDIYWHDPDTLFISIHQDGRTLFPGSGFPQEMGGPTAIGTTINLPLPPHTGEAGIMYAMREIVMPIVRDFKPDLIINSAGQDNHFTDPITSMNFTAQGYAELTDLLQPDIAVLEGGYSIEGALPYVNLGIILAMAGMDYSRVVEPNYDPDKLQQPPTIDDWLKTLHEQTMETWNNRSRLLEKALGGNEFAHRSKQVFYDTDSISENQNEVLRVCQDCSGVFRIESSSDRGKSALAIHIPRNACRICSDIGREWFDKADMKTFGQALLQDRPNDEYLAK
jgi:hypothetical protein